MSLPMTVQERAAANGRRSICARNLPQHFNGCSCTSTGIVTAEAHDIDLVPACSPCDEAETVACPKCSGSGFSSPGDRCASCWGSGQVSADSVAQDGIEYSPRDCDGCNGTGEYYAKTCHDCHGVGRRELSPRVRPAPAFADRETLDAMSDEAFADHINATLWPRDLYPHDAPYFESAGAISLKQDEMEALRDELRARKTAEIPGMDGHTDRVALYAHASERLFHQSWHSPGVPEDPDEVIGYIRRRGYRLGDDGRSAATAALEAFTSSDPRCAEALLRNLTGARSEAYANDFYTSKFDEPIAQAALRLGASRNPQVRRVVAELAPVRSQVLDVLATDPDRAVRQAVAQRATSIIVARQIPQGPRGRKFSIDLDRHERVLVRDGAVQRDKDGRATVKMLESLATDPDTEVRREMAKATLFPSGKALKALATDPDPMVRHLLVENIKRKDVDPDILDTLSRDPEPGIREALRDSGADLPEKAARRLAGAAPGQPTEYAVENGQIVQRVARTPKTPGGRFAARQADRNR